MRKTPTVNKKLPEIRVGINGGFDRVKLPIIKSGVRYDIEGCKRKDDGLYYLYGEAIDCYDNTVICTTKTLNNDLQFLDWVNFQK